MRPFEIALIAFFGIVAIGSLFVFSNYKPNADPNAIAYGERVAIWGTFESSEMEALLAELTLNNDSFKVVTYTQIDAQSFGNTLIDAIAEGKGPDLVIIPNSLLVSYRSKFAAIPFETLSQRTFADTYIDGAGIFIRSDGTYGIPIGVDPLLMYWNKDIFSSNGISAPPKTWEDLISKTTNSINKFDGSSNLTQSTIAFGQYGNVKNAKNILAMLFFQAGSEIVTESNNSYVITLDRTVNNGLSPGVAGLSFYSQFSLPNKKAYSWSPVKSSDRAEFIRGTLALYFGMGSEQKVIERDNSNLNYDVAVVPQGSGATIHRTYGDFYAFAIPRSSKNINGAYAVASFLSDGPQVKKICDAFGLSPVRRSLFVENQIDPFKSILYQSALIAQGWLDPSPQETSQVFRMMIEDAQLHEAQIQDSAHDGIERIRGLFK